MPTTLDPKLDVVFKLLFSDPVNTQPLISLLSAVLRPASPIRSVTVLNPEPPKAEVDDKGVALDVRVRLEDGRQIDVEMQTQSRPAQRERALFYWARMFTGQAGRGGRYAALQPCVVIFILAYPELPGSRFHSTFRVLEVRDQTLFSSAFELHAVELPKLPRPEQTETEEQQLASWARFLAADTDEEREGVAMNNPDIHQAQETLERLSLDPAARELARRREDALFLYKAELQKAQAEGEAKGRAEGEARGEARMLHSSVRALCKVLGISVDRDREAQLEGMARDELQRIFDVLQNERRWP